MREKACVLDLVALEVKFFFLNPDNRIKMKNDSVENHFTVGLTPSHLVRENGGHSMPYF